MSGYANRMVQIRSACEQFRRLQSASDLNASSAFTVAAAIGTAGYSFIDDIGTNFLQLVPNDDRGGEKRELA